MLCILYTCVTNSLIVLLHSKIVIFDRGSIFIFMLCPYNPFHHIYKKYIYTLYSKTLVTFPHHEKVSYHSFSTCGVVVVKKKYLCVHDMYILGVHWCRKFQMYGCFFILLMYLFRAHVFLMFCYLYIY